MDVAVDAPIADVPMETASSGGTSEGRVRSVPSSSRVRPESGRARSDATRALAAREKRPVDITATIAYVTLMPTVFAKGDIFHTDGLRAYAHGCNCTGAMDAGVAVAFRKKWPRMYEEYRLRCEQKRFGLGDVFVWSEGDEVVYSLGIQEHWKQKAQLPALSKSLTKMAELAAHAKLDRVGLPRIAAGLGGLDWPRVKKVLNEVGRQTPVTLLVFEQFIRGAAPADSAV